MLELHRWLCRIRAQRPLIIAIDSPFRAHREKRLDGEHHAFMDAATIGWIAPCRNFFRLFVQPTANAVAGEIADQRIALALRKTLHRFADV